MAAAYEGIAVYLERPGLGDVHLGSGPHFLVPLTGCCGRSLRRAVLLLKKHGYHGTLLDSAESHQPALELEKAQKPFPRLDGCFRCVAHVAVGAGREGTSRGHGCQVLEGFHASREVEFHCSQSSRVLAARSH